MKKLLCIFSLSALFAAQGQDRSAAAPDAVSPAEKAELSAALPVPASFGFKPRGEVRYYSADLDTYLKAGAQAYRQYGLVAMAHQEYQSKSLEATVDLYDMGDPLHAFGIYAAERLPGDHVVEIGGDGYAREGLLNFFQGRFYIKVTATGDKARTAPMLEIIARYVSQKIWTGLSLPKEIAWFPTHGLVPHSQEVVVQSPLGHEFLAPATTARYRFGDQETKLVISLAEDSKDAGVRLARMKKTLANSSSATRIPDLPVEAWRGTTRTEGDVILFALGRYAVVVVHPPPQPGAFLKEIASGIKE